jgi:hypothetical protein
MGIQGRRIEAPKRIVRATTTTDTSVTLAHERGYLVEIQTILRLRCPKQISISCLDIIVGITSVISLLWRCLGRVDLDGFH